MIRLELLDKSSILYDDYIRKEVQLKKFVQKWLEGEIQISFEEAQKTVDNFTEQIKQLKSQSDEFFNEYKRVKREEEMRQRAVNSVRHYFNTSPDEIIITGGVASQNARETHLIGRSKTFEELENERIRLVALIKEKAVRRQISLIEASKLMQDVNIAYNTNMEVQENTQVGMRR